jgi:hypothetical protein
VKEIQLSGGQIALVDDEDYEMVNRWKWKTRKFRHTNYAMRNYWYKQDKSRTITMHHLIIGRKEGYVVDHINGNGLDNRRCNLRHVTSRQNAQNLHIRKLSKYIGVSWYKQTKKWQAQIKINGKSKHLGYYANEEDAFRAYCKAVVDLGEDLSVLQQII